MATRLAPVPAARPALTSDTRVRVTDLAVAALIGINPIERTRRQPLIVSVELGIATPGAIGVLAHTVDYRRIAAEAEALAHDHIDLIETYAQRLGERCLDLGPVDWADVSISKPQALAQGAASVSVRIAREAVLI